MLLEDGRKEGGGSSKGSSKGCWGGGRSLWLWWARKKGVCTVYNYTCDQIFSLYAPCSHCNVTVIAFMGLSRREIIPLQISYCNTYMQVEDKIAKCNIQIMQIKLCEKKRNVVLLAIKKGEKKLIRKMQEMVVNLFKVQPDCFFKF